MFTPKQPDLNDPASVLAYLKQPLIALREALDDGVSFAEVTLHRLPRDPYLWAHLARYRAVHYLKAVDSPSWSLAELANSGIAFSTGPVSVRVLKRISDGPPSPGSSRARRAYYLQQSLPLVWGDIVEPILGANLVIDWNVDSSFRLSLALSKPLGVWRYQTAPRLEWRVFVPFDEDGQPTFTTENSPLDPELDLSELEGLDEAQ